jgi:hypothetical protein
MHCFCEAVETAEKECVSSCLGLMQVFPTRPNATPVSLLRERLLGTASPPRDVISIGTQVALCVSRFSNLLPWAWRCSAGADGHRAARNAKSKNASYCCPTVIFAYLSGTCGSQALFALQHQTSGASTRWSRVAKVPSFKPRFPALS